jgi:hypothetical protein
VYHRLLAGGRGTRVRRRAALDAQPDLRPVRPQIGCAHLLLLQVVAAGVGDPLGRLSALAADHEDPVVTRPSFATLRPAAIAQAVRMVELARWREVPDAIDEPGYWRVVVRLDDGSEVIGEEIGVEIGESR